jgi:hypothetical protein
MGELVRSTAPEILTPGGPEQASDHALGRPCGKVYEFETTCSGVRSQAFIAPAKLSDEKSARWAAQRTVHHTVNSSSVRSFDAGERRRFSNGAQ